MSLSHDEVASSAKTYLDEAHHRKDLDDSFNNLSLRDQWRVTRGMQHLNADYEAQHPDLPKIQITTFEDGQLKELDVKGRIWGWNSCYSRDKDPGVPDPVKGALQGLFDKLNEIGDP